MARESHTERKLSDARSRVGRVIVFDCLSPVTPRRGGADTWLPADLLSCSTRVAGSRSSSVAAAIASRYWTLRQCDRICYAESGRPSRRVQDAPLASARRERCWRRICGRQSRNLGAEDRGLGIRCESEWNDLRPDCERDCRTSSVGWQGCMGQTIPNKGSSSAIWSDCLKWPLTARLSHPAAAAWART